MGKTKVAIIDDSAPDKKSLESRVKSQGKKKESEKVNPNPEVLAKEKAQEKVTEETEELKETEVEAAKQPKQTKSKTPKQGEPKYRSKKYQEALEKVERSKKYPLNEAIDLAKSSSYTKFDGSLEVHINTNVKNIRGLVSLPFASGKKLKILAFGKGADTSGADIVGDEEKLEEIIKGKADFDVLVATPEWMSKLAKAAKVLGPRGLMPSPKNGTISTELKKAVSEIQSGKVEYKTQKDSQVIHLSLGKVSQPSDEISQNIKVLMNAIGKTKAQKIVVSPTMGVGVKVDLQSI